jgi:hypothetical protein
MSLAWRTDTQLHDAVRLQLDEDPAIRANDIAVVASEGVITLTGFVDNYAEKIAAEETAKHVRGVFAVKTPRGVRGVSNLIRISQTPTSVEVRTRIEQALEQNDWQFHTQTVLGFLHEFPPVLPRKRLL